MINKKLIEQVKRKLNITWEDPETDARIDDIVASAIPDMIHLLGIPEEEDEEFDFSDEGLENTLFLAYCFYEWNHSIDEFEDNYSKKLARAKDKWAVKSYEAESEI